MRLLMLCQSMDLGGAETHVLELSRELVRLGERVTVVSPDGALVPALLAAGVEHVALPLHSLSPRAVRRCLKGLSALLDGERFDFVHAHARRPAFYLSLLASRRNDVRPVTTCHGAFKVTPLLTALTFWGDGVLAVSEDIRDYLLRHYPLRKEQIALTVNGIDTARFYPSKKETGGRNILTVSRLDAPASRGAEMLLSVFPRILALYPDATLTVAGGGERLAAMRRMGERLGLPEGTLRFTGPLSDVREELGRADLFVGVSRAALEAASSGLPVLLSGAEGLLGLPRTEEDWLSAGRTNWCRGEELTEEGLFAALSAALERTEDFASLGETARRFVLSHVSLSAMAESYRAFYRSQPPRLFFRSAEALVSGYYGYGNAGDDAMLKAMLEGIRRRIPDVRLRVIAKSPRLAARQYGASCVGRLNGVGIMKNLRPGSTFISGGGTLLQDATSLRSLRYYLTLLSAAVQRGCRVAVYAAGVGPLKRESSRRGAARAVLRAHRVSVRDESAKAFLCRLGVPSERIVTGADPVFLEMPRKAEAPLDRFAVSVMRSAVDFPSESDFDAFLRCFSGGVKQIAAETGLKAVFVPMQKEKDGELNRRCAAMAGGEVTEEDPREAIAKSAFAVGMRLHTLVFAAAAGRPALGVSTDPKISGFSAAAGFRAPLDPKEATPEALAEAAGALLSGKDGGVAEERISRLKKAAEEDLDGLCRLIRREKTEKV